jgi:hypothetical protein
MSLLGSLANNPDVAVLVSGLVGYLGKQLWNKAKEKTHGEIWDTALKVAYQAFPKLFSDPKLYDDDHVREVISRTIWKGLARIEIPKNATTEKLVAEVVEHAVGELALMLWKHNFGETQKRLEATVEKLDTLPSITKP